MTKTKTKILVPDELRDIRQWMLWRSEMIGDKPNKSPYSIYRNDRRGSSTEPDDWSDYDSVHAAYLKGSYDGLAFVMTAQDSVVGIDLDGCFDETGNPLPWAAEILARFADTYVEISPSGKGVKIFTFGSVPGSLNKSFGNHVGIEGYCQGRFFTVTGNLYGQHPRQLTSCQTGLDWLWETHGNGIDPDEESFAGFRMPKLPRDLIIRHGGRDKFVNRIAFAYAYICQNNEELVLRCLVETIKFMEGKEDFPQSLLRQKVSNACRAGWKNQRSAAEALVRDNVVQQFCPQLTLDEETAIPVDGKNANWDIGDHIVRRIIAHQHSDPTIFNSNNRLKQIVRSKDGIALAACTDHDLNRRMSQATNFTKDGVTPIEAPLKWATHINGALDCIRAFPELSSITEAPLYDLETGNLQTNTGYNESRQAYYYSPQPIKPFVPENPTFANVRESVEFINEKVMAGFNFMDNGSSKAGAIAMVLTSLLRSSFEETAPLFVVDAAEAGSGKSYLCRLTSWISTGNDLKFCVYSPRPEEFEKRLSSYMLTKPGQIIAFDNVKTIIDSAELCQILTSTTYQPRLLGGNEVPTLKNTNTWIANGNNVKLGEDLMRRTIHIRIGMHNDGPDLQRWVLDNRNAVLTAFYTISRYWSLQGRPEPTGFKPLSSFERWSAVIGGILETAGIRGFMNEMDRESSRDILDSQGDEIGEFLTALYAQERNNQIRTGDLLTKILANSNYQQIAIRLPSNARQYNVTSLGKVLHTWSGKTRRGLTLVRTAGKSDGVSYTIETAKKG